MSDKVRPKFWIDIDHDGRWGIESDVESLTFDGHYVCVAGISEESRETLERIVNMLNTYHPPVKP